MNEPVRPHEHESVAHEHAHVRSEVARLAQALSDRMCGRGTGSLARELGVLRARLLAHFEHEELSWSALGERLQSAEFCSWTAEFTAQHRAFALRTQELVDELGHRETEGLPPLPAQAARLAEFFEDLLRHERGEGHLLARHAGFEDEGCTEL
ncbi:MAG: hypothetical protein IPJ77_01050 [Planctomycetes bacterium]|nr:hypothetical protein [Planctomycetota bacterium]